MLRELLRSAIHGARVTACRPDADNALIVDRDLLAAADLLPLERIEVMNLTRGSSIAARCAAGPAGSHEVVCAGDLARFASEGDLLSITAAAWLDREGLPYHLARIVMLDDANRVSAVLERTPFDLAD
jgi:aspartate 1-decarboxylase